MPSQLNQPMQALSDSVDDCREATPRSSHYQELCCESSPETSKGGGRGVVNHLERVKAVFDSHSFPYSGETWHCSPSSVCVCVYYEVMPLSTSSTARRMPAGPFLQATAQAPPEAKLHPAGLALPRGYCLRGTNRWRVLGETPPAGPSKP